MTVAAAVAGRTGAWQLDPGFGMYVHVPFCFHRCHYCDFNTYEGLEGSRGPYVDALIAEIQRDGRAGRAVTSVFFGGGTPTLLAPRQLARVLEAIDDRFGIASGAEVTIEANPETIDVAYLRELVHAGFNRLSVGVQSLAPGVLERLGRTHSASRALQALHDARAAGFEDLNADLIYGSPWESSDEWVASLAGVIDAGPDHVSAYSLTVEQGTPLHTLVATGRESDVDPDVQADRHGVATEMLGAAGYERYEISNWGRPGRASAHNVLYWSAGDYLGFGAGAHSHLSGRRWWSHRLPRDYIDSALSGRSTEAGCEELDADARAGEALMLGLRLASGIERDRFVQRFTAQSLEARGAGLRYLVDAGLLEPSSDVIRLTPRGTLLASEVAARLL